MTRFTSLGVAALLAVSLIAIAHTAAAQSSISGRVLDEQSRRPMEYVNVVLYRTGDSSLVTGTVTNENGAFELQNVAPGRYYMHLRFIGYETATLSDLNLQGTPLDIGTVRLSPAAINIGDVVVEGARSTFTYQIDKKVIDVDQLSTSLSGTAAEVLANVPSVSVDIEGNVSLRGSGNFTVLIDGKPSVLDAQDALQQIPASSIGSIEIITNPSAKHDPEGTAGVINIKMKKQSGRGWSGLADANVGLNDKYGGDLLFQHRAPSMNALLGVDYNTRTSPGTSTGEERYIFEGNTSTIQTSGDMRMIRNSLGVRSEIEFGVGDNGSMSVSGRYGTRDWQRNSILQHLSFTSNTARTVASRNDLRRKRSGEFSAVDGRYQRTFSPDGHKLAASLMFRYRDSDELTISELYGDQPTTGKRTTEAGPSREINARIEYVLPFSDVSRFEAGYQGERDISEESTTLSEYSPAITGYNLLPQFSNHVEYSENEHAIYALYAAESGPFGYQAGLRGEYTYRTISLLDGPAFTVDRWNLFPTLHVSYTFAQGNQLMASYTRRINRPRGWQLEPFDTWIDANNLRRGNPALIPEYIDSYEAGVQTLLGQVTLSTELYHRVNHNKIEDVRSVFGENITLTTFGNLGTEYSSGVEMLANFDLVKDWNMNLIGNAYDYRIRGVLFNEAFSRRSFNWSARFNNIIKLSPVTQIQLNARWDSPSVSAQGRREGFASVDVAAKQEFLNKQLSLTLQVQNVLKTARHEFTSQGPGFYSYNDFRMESPVVMLNVRFSINNYKPEREQRGGGFGEDEF